MFDYHLSYRSHLHRVIWSPRPLCSSVISFFLLAHLSLLWSLSLFLSLVWLASWLAGRRGPGLRGSNPAKIDHFLLFCELQTCEPISSDGVCSLYLKMGWLCSEGPSEQSHVSEKVQTGMSSE
jgi:hypothetical protein